MVVKGGMYEAQGQRRLRMTKNLVLVDKWQQRCAVGFHTLAVSPAAASISYAARRFAPARLSLQVPFLLCTLRSVEKSGNRVVVKVPGFCEICCRSGTSRLTE